MNAIKIRWAFLWLLFIVGGALGPLSAQDAYQADEVLVNVRAGVSLDTIHARYGTSVLDHIPGTRSYRLALPAGTDVRRVLAQMYEAEYIDGGEPNYIAQAPEAEQSSMAFIDPSGAPYIDGSSPPSYFGQPPAMQVRAEEAHRLSTGQGVVVAVIDTGMALDHPAVSSRIALPFYDFVDNDADPSEEPGGVGYGHGTFVAGLIALLAPGARIMPLRALDRDGRGQVFNIAKALYFAVDHGARVINMSFGMAVRSEFIERAIRYARSEHQDRTRPRLLVASAGNSNQRNPPQFPARDERVFAVTAVDDQDFKADFSNFGSYITISAPGVDLYSTYPWTDGVENDGFAWWSGTSFAAPFLAAEAALILERFPTLSFDRLRDRIRDRTRLVNIDRSNPRYEGQLGRGRIDLWLAVR